MRGRTTLLLEDLQGFGGALLQAGVRHRELDIQPDEPRETHRAPEGEEETQGQVPAGLRALFTL